LRLAEKLAAKGQLAAAIAHEVNNPVQALTNLLALLALSASLDPDNRRLVSLAENELSRVAHITRQMLSFYRESAPPEPVRLTEVIDGILEAFGPGWQTKHIEIERRYAYEEPICGFPVEIQQVVANLLQNAADAIGQQGRICIHVAASRDWAKPERRGVRVTIADKGPGIPHEFKDRIFEPFFTTKKQKGTGLGLWVAKGIVAKHEGSLRVRSSTAPQHSGTVFSVFFPGKLDSEANREEKAA
jgi:signal transduction histidine kinase